MHVAPGTVAKTVRGVVYTRREKLA
eukprot:COSAG02_NODE_38167_length_432_cov_1.081081_1_plen_24_part_10